MKFIQYRRGLDPGWHLRNLKCNSFRNQSFLASSAIACRSNSHLKILKFIFKKGCQKCSPLREAHDYERNGIYEIENFPISTKHVWSPREDVCRSEDVSYKKATRTGNPNPESACVAYFDAFQNTKPAFRYTMHLQLWKMKNIFSESRSFLLKSLTNNDNMQQSFENPSQGLKLFVTVGSRSHPRTTHQFYFLFLITLRSSAISSCYSLRSWTEQNNHFC